MTFLLLLSFDLIPIGIENDFLNQVRNYTYRKSLRFSFSSFTSYLYIYL